MFNHVLLLAMITTVLCEDNWDDQWTSLIEKEFLKNVKANGWKPIANVED
jgi:hypothetical protein